VCFAASDGSWLVEPGRPRSDRGGSGFPPSRRLQFFDRPLAATCLATGRDTPATVAIRPLLLKPQWMNGLSERLLVSHYANNYSGALRRLNAIRARLAALDCAQTPSFEINGLKREELMTAGSVIMHEIYFESLGGHGDSPPRGRVEPPAGLAEALTRDFGSAVLRHKTCLR
jgi:Fe-Mn family superoxide dismutase